MSTPRALVVTLTLICGLLIHTAAAQGQSTKDPALERATRLLRSTILVDGHNDLPMTIREFKDAPRDVIAYDLRQPTKGDTDIARLRAGGLGAQFWSAYIPGEGSGPYARQQLEQIDIARRVIERYPDVFMFARSVADVRAAKRAGKIASMLGMEGGYGLENSIGALRAYHDLGVRYMALTHNTHTDWADAAAPLQPRNNGLTPFGEEIVREMNRLGMLIDLSHAAPSTMAHTLRISAAPVIFSHSSAKAVCNVPRNVPDDILRELPKNGGVVMVTFVSSFINCEVGKVLQPAMAEIGLRARAAATPEEAAKIRAEGFAALKLPPTSIAMVADHIEHIRNIAGVDHIGIGGDFDGNDWWPEGLDDVSTYPKLFAELIRRGWSDQDLKKLAGENLLRAWARTEKVGERLRRERPPSTVVYTPPKN
ncbi:MAG: membrane dipeptidase [Gammaproteobacteria bacterium]|nr:membrane dipeptidase [Gammaproteobacteria bacterium]